MNFPGEKYEQYLQDPDTRASYNNALNVGIRRFLFQHKVDKRVKPLIDSKKFDEIVHADLITGHALRKFPDGTSIECPIFWLGINTLVDLERMVDESDYIFVYCEFRSARTPYVKHDSKYAEPLRWIHEMQTFYGDKVKFIAFGSFEFEIYYCMGMAGSAVVSHRNQTWRLNHDGTRRLKNRAEVLDYTASRFPGAKESELALLAILDIPVYLKSYYSIPNVPVENLGYTKQDVRKGYPFRSTRIKSFDSSDGGSNYNPAAHRFLFSDGVTCSTCSLSYCCKLYRPLGVCRVSGTTGNELAEKFGSGDAKQVLSGLSDLVGKQAELTQKALKNQDEKLTRDPDAELDPAVNKMVADLFRNGTQLAKLLDPSLTKVRVEVGGAPKNPNVIEGEVVKTVEQLPDREKSKIIREMVEAGIDRDDITAESILDWLAKGEQPQLNSSKAKEMPF